MPTKNIKEYNSNESKSVIILAYSWPPDANVGAVRPVYLARQLALSGWHPIAMTVKERYYDLINNSGIAGSDSAIVIRTRCIPNIRHVYLWMKRIIAWFSGGKTTENLAASLGVPGNEGPGSCESAPSWLKKTILSLLYTPDEFLGWLPFAVVSSLKACRNYKAQCLISTGPPFTSHLVALLLKNIYGIAWVADFRDPWAWNETSSVLTSGISDRINHWLERAVMRRADRIVCVTAAMTEMYRKLYPDLPENKWITITNGYDMEEFAELTPVVKSDRFTISYVGSFDFSRTPALMLKAVRELIEEGTIDKQKVNLRFVGPCQHVAERPLLEVIAEHGLSEVADVIGFVPRTEALREVLHSDMLLLLGGTQRLSVAAKTYEYMAAGKPILAIVEEGATADIIRQARVGRVVAPQDLESAKQAIAAWYGQYFQDKTASDECSPDKGENFCAATGEYSWDKLGARYSALLEEIYCKPPFTRKSPN